MAEKPVQDAETLLKEACHVYPDATHLLNAVQLLAVKMEPMKPFSKGSESEQFLKLAEAYFVTKYSIDHAQEALRVALLEPQAKGDMNDKKAVIQCLDLVRHLFFILVCTSAPTLTLLTLPTIHSYFYHLPQLVATSLLSSTDPDTSEVHMGQQSEGH